MPKLNAISISQQKWLIWGFIALLWACLFGAVITEVYLLAALPAVFLLGYLTVLHFRLPFWLLLLSIPFSVEIYLPGGLGTDLPSEPLMWLLLGLGVVYALRHGRELSGAPLRHPITLLLFLHLGWILLTTLTSSDFIISLKYALAKSWYVAAFFFMSLFCLKTEKDYRRLFWLIFPALSLTILLVLVRQAMMGFAFDGINSVMGPFYRNKVMYASLSVVFLPFLWFARYWYPAWSAKRWLLGAGLLLFLVGIYFSYTRAAMGCVMVAVGGYYIIRWKLTRWILLAGVVVTGLAVAFLTTNYKYLDFAPQYERTVYHDKFDNLLAATYKLEDISTMERVYRWVAGGRMLADRPWLGFGPGTFYFVYRSYTVINFRTYVSNNPEKSGVHNYYLMVATEQGVIGLLLYLAFAFFTLLKGEQIYHRLRTPWRKHMLMAALLSLIIIHTLQVMNDMLETVKVGSLFWLCTAVVVVMGVYSRKQELIPNLDRK